MGAMALFGEKYGDEVRVIRYGDSVELCGGTHVANTGNIGMIRIVSESSIAAGVRRIEAITGRAVEDAADAMTSTLTQLAGMLGNAPDVVAALRRSIAENADLKKQVEDYFNERAQSLTKTVLEKADTVGSGILLATLRGPIMPDMVKNVAFGVRAASPKVTAFVAATVDGSGKPLLTVMLTDDLAARGLNASQIVHEAAKAIKGGGGGQPGFAQAGGKDAEGLSVAFESMTAAFK